MYSSEKPLNGNGCWAHASRMSRSWNFCSGVLVACPGCMSVRVQPQRYSCAPGGHHDTSNSLACYPLRRGQCVCQLSLNFCARLSQLYP